MNKNHRRDDATRVVFLLIVPPAEGKPKIKLLLLFENEKPAMSYLR